VAMFGILSGASPHEPMFKIGLLHDDHRDEAWVRASFFEEVPE
jgi:hypothetical protein